MKKSITLLSLLLITSCSNEYRDNSNASFSDNSLIGGSEVFDSTKYNSVLLLQSGCTASKVADNLILTAAHCVVDFYSGDLRYSYRKGTYVTVKSKNSMFERYEIKKTHVYSKYTEKMKDFLYGSNPNRFPGYFAGYFANDIALIETVDTIDIGEIGEVSLTKVEEGTRVDILGYGCEVSTRDPWPNPRRLKAQSVQVKSKSDLLKTEISSRSSMRQLSDSILGANFLTEGKDMNRDAASLCPGDSGGPVYRIIDGKEEIVGVNSYYTFNPGSGVTFLNLHTRFDSEEMASWIKSFIK